MLITLALFTYWILMYGYGALSCRPNGTMFELIKKIENQDWPDMSATWLAEPLRSIKNYQGVATDTCGGTQGGKRPFPDVDLFVCTPTMNASVDDTWIAWKANFVALSGLSFAFLAIGMPFRRAVRDSCDALEANSNEVSRPELEEAHAKACIRRWNFVFICGLVWGIAAHGLIGWFIMMFFCGLIFWMARKMDGMELGRIHLATWIVVFLTMEFTFRCLGDSAHEVFPELGNQGIFFWNRVEGWLCPNELTKEKLVGKDPAEVCFASQLFLLKGLCPWYLYRFMSLKLISYSFDYSWHRARTPSVFAGRLETKCDLEQRVESNDLPLERYSFKYFQAYMFYVPLYSVGPILSYNAFVSQMEQPQKTYNRNAVLKYAMSTCVLVLIMEIFSVVWWYPFEFHNQTCDGTEPCMFEKLNPWELFVATHVRLHFTWMGLLLVWRYGRLVALFDGIDSWENMSKCVTMITSFTDLWQIWHASMNKFMARYLFIPLGGNKCPWAVIVVFTFIAYWHEGCGLFSIPHWYLWAFFNALGVTLEKVLLPKRWLRDGFQERMRKRDFAIYPVRGFTIVFVILANLPAQYFSGVWQYYSALLLQGGESAALILSVFLAFTASGYVADYLEQDPAKLEDTPLLPSRDVALQEVESGGNSISSRRSNNGNNNNATNTGNNTATNTSLTSNNSRNGDDQASDAVPKRPSFRGPDASPLAATTASTATAPAAESEMASFETSHRSSDFGANAA